MSGLTLVVILIVIAALGATVWGLFNRHRSILCAVAGILIALGAIPGGLHAWGEAHSMAWTTVYALVLVLGLVSTLRQILMKDGRWSI